VGDIIGQMMCEAEDIIAKRLPKMVQPIGGI
jgi:hypothetical protein